MRPEAVVIIPCFCLGLVYGGRRRSAALVFSISLTIWGSFFIRNWVQTQYVEKEYAGDFRNVLVYWSTHQTHLWAQARRAAESLCVENLLGISLGSSSGPSVFKALWVGLTAALSVTGLVSFSRRTDLPGRSVLLAMGSFGVFYFGIHTLWGILDARYFLPLMPWVLLFLLQGIHHANQIQKRSGFISLLALAGVLVVYGCQNGNAVYESLIHTPWSNRVPLETFRWLRRETSPDAVFLSPLGPTLYLYAERSNIMLVRNKDEDEVRYDLLLEGVQFILDQPLTFTHSTNSLDPNEEWKNIRRWIRLYPNHFEVIYKNETEQSILYKVLPDPTFVAAYNAYRLSLRDLQEGSWRPALKRLDHVLAIQPDFASALNVYGATLLLLRQNLPDATRLLKHAIEVRPNFPLALLNLSDVLKLRGKTSLAEMYLQESLDASKVMDNDKAFEGVIEQHQKSPLNYRELFRDSSPPLALHREDH